jgi:hypothetical protein
MLCFDAMPAHQSCYLRHLAQASCSANHLRTSFQCLGIKALRGQTTCRLSPTTTPGRRRPKVTMEYFSLKRSNAADRGQSNLSSKVYVRSTKSGKVQKIVRELYLRRDIPCSSHLCRACLDIAPTDYSKKGECNQKFGNTWLTIHSGPIRAFRHSRWNQRLSKWPLPITGY